MSDASRLMPDACRLGYGYATHLPALIECVLRTTGPVLELGAGSFSTPILHELCSKRGRMLFTVEADRLWREQFGWMAGEHHALAESVKALPALPERLAVVLIDCKPAEQRRPYFEAFADRAEFLVCHDWQAKSCRWPDCVELASRGLCIELHDRLMPLTAVLQRGPRC